LNLLVVPLSRSLLGFDKTKPRHENVFSVKKIAAWNLNLLNKKVFDDFV